MAKQCVEDECLRHRDAQVAEKAYKQMNYKQLTLSFS